VEADQKKEAATMKLSLDLPWLSLNKPVLPDLPERSEHADEFPNLKQPEFPCPISKSTPAINSDVAEVSKPVSKQVLGNSHAGARKSLSICRPDPASAKADCKYSRSDVVRTYFDNMEQFLGIQQDVLSAYIKAKKRRN
jgi:hypothetical protein